MIYIEFIERDPWVPIEVFRHIGNQHVSWSEDSGMVDHMLLQLGRTMRLGPRPSYLCLWDIPDIGRLDAWEKYFHSPAAGRNYRSQALHRTINFDRAGLYDVLDKGPSIDAPVYVVEYCDPRQADDVEIRSAFADRVARHPEVHLIRLLRRLGQLGPDPALLSIWGAASYAAAEPLLRDTSLQGLRGGDLGIYRAFGEEIW
jgi:hypothetical protein